MAGWRLSWNQPSQLSRNYALAGYDRTHNFQMGFLYDLPVRARARRNPVAAIVRDWQVNGVYSFYSGTPFTIGGDNTALNQRGGTQTIDLIAPLQRVGDPGPNARLLQPGVVRPAGQQVGQHGTQSVPRAERVQPRHGSVPWLPGRTLSPGVPCDGQQRAEPLALGQSRSPASRIRTS